jgi:hypothetical protein
MPKQVRLRRGTTAQHATFTGADGEVTFDTTKKVLVVHDGVTAGGKPIDGFVKLDLGDPLVIQEIKSAVSITGSDADHVALAVTHPVQVNEFTAAVSCEVKRLAVQQEALAYAGTINLDFNGFGGKRIALAGNVSFTSGSFGFGKHMIVRIVCDTSLRTLVWPAAWKWVGAAAPANIAANKTGLLQLWCFGTSESDVVARWLVEP